MPAPDALTVAIIRSRYNPFGGAERFVQRALGALVARQVQVTVIARDWAPGDTDGLPVRLAFLKVDPPHVGRLLRDWSFARAVRHLLARRDFSVVQSHERIPGVALYRAGDGVHASFLAQRRRVLNRWRGALLRFTPYHAWLLRAERRMFTDPALRAVICNSEMVRKDIGERFGVEAARLHLIRNGVDLDRFRPPTAVERSQARAGFGLNPEAVVFAFVGSGFERKGLRATIQALASSEAPHGAVLLVAGTDRHLERYRALAHRLGVGDAVHFLGGLADVRPVLHAADGFVLPTLYDPFPNAVLEALACGLPTVTSTTCGAAELIEPGVNGFIVDAFDIAGLAAALRRLAEPEARAARGVAARRSVEPLTLEAMTARLVAVYRTLIAPDDGSRTLGPT